MIQKWTNKTSGTEQRIQKCIHIWILNTREMELQIKANYSIKGARAIDYP